MGENHDHHAKPAKKSIKIDSILIDLFSSDYKCDDQKTEIFSICGYVSDMHKKDLKMCLPFADIDDLRKMDERILSVPPVYDSSFDEQQGERRWQESSNMAADQGFIFDGCQDVINGRTMVGNASNSSCDRKGKKLEVADNCNVALISQTEPGCASQVHDIEPEKSLAAHLNGHLNIDQEHHTAKLQETGDASMESFESKVSSSESAESVGNSLHRRRYQGTSRRRRAPKFRLLTELLAESENMKAKQPESSPSNVTPKASLQAAPKSVKPSRTSKYAADRAAILAHDNEFSSRNSRSTSLNAMESKSSTSKNPNSSKESLNNYANPQRIHKRIRRGRRRGESEQPSDRGSSDDIPMEIVELMARNQYERRISDAENHMLWHNASVHSQEESSNGYDIQSSEGFIDHLPVSEQNKEQACSWSSFEAHSHKLAESSFPSRPNVVERHQDRVDSNELYSDETISAMHLLSLMDARTPSNAPFQLSTGFETDTNLSGRAVSKSRNGSKMKCSAPSASSNDRKPLTGTLKNKTSFSETETCSVNKNPADFSFSEAENTYMIGGRSPVSKNRSSSVRSDDRSKRPRIV
ncbi:uncharacterized protein LOC111462800 isoform X1 [Cucurbita moschata]|uniref:Uncharacterized protein LOC111462800 isoform X1 n=1 Tax=Cucurbita moschata TaxID=3662 RepID=A0A6J1HCD5_CUCMO|nr:uncharacterized protein LOC111462800 isoform X1 [Cucurbita moschata]